MCVQVAIKNVLKSTSKIKHTKMNIMSLDSAYNNMSEDSADQQQQQPIHERGSPPQQQQMQMPRQQQNVQYPGPPQQRPMQQQQPRQITPQQQQQMQAMMQQRQQQQATQQRDNRFARMDPSEEPSFVQKNKVSIVVGVVVISLLIGVIIAVIVTKKKDLTGGVLPAYIGAPVPPPSSRNWFGGGDNTPAVSVLDSYY